MNIEELKKENEILKRTNCENAKSVLDIEKPYKDLLEKIRDKIKEIEKNPNNPNQKVRASQIDASLITCLKELLGEEGYKNE